VRYTGGRRKKIFNSPARRCIFGVIAMLYKRFGFASFVFIVAATVIIPAVLTDAASAQGSWVNCLWIVQLFNSPADYRWMGDWDPRFDPDFQAHYCGVKPSECDVRCDLEFSCQACRPR